MHGVSAVYLCALLSLLLGRHTSCAAGVAFVCCVSQQVCASGERSGMYSIAAHALFWAALMPMQAGILTLVPPHPNPDPEPNPNPDPDPNPNPNPEPTPNPNPNLTPSPTPSQAEESEPVQSGAMLEVAQP